MHHFESEKFIAGNHSNVRNINRCVILNVIRQFQPISQVEISNHINLTKGTISSIVNELIADGLVQELSVGESTGGRKPTLLKLATTGVIIGIMTIHQDTTVLAIGDMDGNILRKKVIPTNRENAEKFISECGEKLLRIMSTIEFDKLLGVGLCIPGLVSRDQEQILHAPKLGWHNVAVALILEKIFEVPIYVENDANLKALAQLFFSKQSDGIEDFVLTSIGEGIGVGIVQNQMLLRGTTTSSIEFGHTTINEIGEECTCGNRGCWEAYASDWATIRRYNRLKYKYSSDKSQDFSQTTVSRLTVQPIENGIKLEWDDTNKSVAKYLIYRDASPEFQVNPTNQISSMTHSPYIDVTAKQDVQYYYKVQPVNSLDQTGVASQVRGCVAPELTKAFDDDIRLDFDSYAIAGDLQVMCEGGAFTFGASSRDADNLVYKKTEFGNYIVSGKVRPVEVGPYDSVGLLLKVQSEDTWYYALIAYGHQLKEKYNIAFVRRRMVDDQRDEVWLAFYPLQIDPKAEYTIKVGVFGDWMKMKAWKSSGDEPANWQLSVKDDLGFKVGSVGFRHFGSKAQAYGLQLIPLPSSVEQNFLSSNAGSESERHILSILAAAKKGDDVAVESLQETARYLGLGIANIFNGVGINTFFVTGQIVQAWNIIEPVIMRELKQRVFAENLNDLRILPLEPNENRKLLGCVALVTRTLFEGYRIVRWRVQN